MFVCIVCRREFLTASDATSGCGGGKHMLQEKIDGSVNTDTGETADFRSIDESDKRKWGEEAKKFFGDDS